MILNRFQCGFRKNQSGIPQDVRIRVPYDFFRPAAARPNSIADRGHSSSPYESRSRRQNAHVDLHFLDTDGDFCRSATDQRNSDFSFIEKVKEFWQKKIAMDLGTTEVRTRFACFRLSDNPFSI
jgi:hypothetical protein